MREIKAKHPKMSHKQMLAIALSEAREAGNTKVKPPSSVKKPKAGRKSRLKGY